MDDRKKQIGDLERRKREQNVSLDALLVRLGEAIFGRIPESVEADTFEEIAVYRTLQHNIVGWEDSIQAVEEQIRRFRELEESIDVKERENSACAKELAVIHARLGKLLLESSDSAKYADFCAPYQDQAEALNTKVLSLEERLSGLEDAGSGNVFTWIGKGAKGLVLRSFLTKAQESLDHLCRNIGERYTRHISARLPGGESEIKTSADEIDAICAAIEEQRTEMRNIASDLSELKEEKKTISGNFNADGGPLKQIQSCKNQIAQAYEELRCLFRRIGAEAAAIYNTECRQEIKSCILPEDAELLDTAARTNRLINEEETAIKKLQAALDIDEERAKIDKYRKTIQEKREKIAQAEKSIRELEANITAAETNIERLAELL